MAESTSSEADVPAVQPEVVKDVGSTKSIAEIAGDVQRTVLESRDSALRSARTLQESSTTHLRSLQGFVRCVKWHYHAYEDAAVDRVKYGLKSGRENPGAAIGLSLTAGLLLLPGPRRFLFRQTIGRLQSEESHFAKADKNVKDLMLSVDMMKNESRKLLERTALAEKEMIRGSTDLINTGNQIQRLARSAYKVEAKAADLMDDLREITGRDSIKLRAEVASMVSNLKQQRVSLENRVLKISEQGVAVLTL